jgi:hypothetical protein
MIDSFLRIWIKKEILKQNNLDVTSSLHKLIELLVCVNLRPYTVIEAIIKFIEGTGLEIKKQPAKKAVELLKTDC